MDQHFKDELSNKSALGVIRFAAHLSRQMFAKTQSTLDWDFSVEIPKLEKYHLFFKIKFIHLEKLCMNVFREYHSIYQHLRGTS